MSGTTQWLVDIARYSCVSISNDRSHEGSGRGHTLDRMTHKQPEATFDFRLVENRSWLANSGETQIGVLQHEAHHKSHPPLT